MLQFVQFAQDATAFAERPRRRLPVGVLRRRKGGAPVGDGRESRQTQKFGVFATGI
jgi:hypothetical protein